MYGESNAKQQIVEKVRQSTNILVTVGANPTVDALSAALALSLILNKLDKHTTAIFSGAIPPAIDFLEPGKLFENSVDGLRDFIISLDKSKADRLRYKVEEDVVKIYITPYRTTLGQDDLTFSQGDYNVELVIALGVDKREDLDKTIIAHGRILHDATVVTINANDQKSAVGNIAWEEPTASSLCEMLMSLGEAIQKGVLDQQISTALLTGIVAATDRFSNEHTTSRVMTMAAQLMAAGANQQLIANNLQKAHEIHGVDEQPKKGNGELSIKHDKATDGKDVPKSEAQATKELEQALPSAAAPAQQAAPTLDELEKEVEAKKKQPKAPNDNKKDQNDKKGKQPSWRDKPAGAPSMGGSLSATTEEAAKEAEERANEEGRRNRKILSHGENKPEESVLEDEPPKIEPIAHDTKGITIEPPTDLSTTLPSLDLPPLNPAPPELPELPPAPAVASSAPDPLPAPAEIAPPAANVEQARQAVQDAFVGGLPPAAPGSENVNALPMNYETTNPNVESGAIPPPPPPMPSAPPPPMPNAPIPPNAPFDMPPPPPLPPMPSNLDVTQPNDTGVIDHTPPPPPIPTAPPPASGPAAPNDPGKFKIPGQG